MVWDTVEVDTGDTGNALQDGRYLSLLAVAAGSAERQGKSFSRWWGCRSWQGHGKACDKECDRDSSLPPESLHEMNPRQAIDSLLITYMTRDNIVELLSGLY